jgi:hypothetical protein
MQRMSSSDVPMASWTPRSVACALSMPYKKPYPVVVRPIGVLLHFQTANCPFCLPDCGHTSRTGLLYVKAICPERLYLSCQAFLALPSQSPQTARPPCGFSSNSPCTTVDLSDRVHLPSPLARSWPKLIAPERHRRFFPRYQLVKVYSEGHHTSA